LKSPAKIVATVFIMMFAAKKIILQFGRTAEKRMNIREFIVRVLNFNVVMIGIYLQ